MGSLALGIDVAARRGCDVVKLGRSLVARPHGTVRTADELRALVRELDPAVVAIDGPPTWAPPGRRRACERALTAQRISVFTTPDAERGTTNAFYDWMLTSFAMFDGAAARPTLETFPHAVAIALLGSRPPHALTGRPSAKLAWRCHALDAAGIDHSALRGIDQIDAALCAVTGLWFLGGRTVALGDPVEGVITLPQGLPAPLTRTR